VIYTGATTVIWKTRFANMMKKLNWIGILEYCQYRAAEGHAVVHLFGDNTEPPSDYEGEETRWPTSQEAFRHFCNHPDAWELLEKGYHWRSYFLREKLSEYADQAVANKITPSTARVAIDATMKEIDLIQKNIREVQEKTKRLAQERRKDRESEDKVRKKASSLAKKQVDEMIKEGELIEASALEEAVNMEQAIKEENSEEVSIAERLRLARENYKKRFEEELIEAPTDGKPN